MSHKRNEALRHVQHSMHHVIAAGEGSDRAPDSCKLCPYYRPDFKFRTCLYAHCPYKKQVNLGKKKPNSFAVRQYKLYKLAAGKTARSILISCGARMAPFDIQEVRDATMYDELELDKLGDRKTALFLIMSDTDSTFNFLISMIYTQLFNLLCDKADDVYGGKLPVHAMSNVM